MDINESVNEKYGGGAKIVMQTSSNPVFYLLFFHDSSLDTQAVSL
jgi:hypothetical protein